MGAYDAALVKALTEGQAGYFDDLLIKANSKVHVKTYWRHDSKTGKLVRVEEHDAEHQGAELMFNQGHKVKATSGAYKDQELEIKGYDPDKKVFRTKHKDNPNVSISPHRIEHVDKEAGKPDWAKQKESDEQAKKAEPKKEEEPVAEENPLDQTKLNYKKKQVVLDTMKEYGVDIPGDEELKDTIEAWKTAISEDETYLDPTNHIGWSSKTGIGCAIMAMIDLGKLKEASNLLGAFKKQLKSDAKLGKKSGVSQPTESKRGGWKDPQEQPKEPEPDKKEEQTNKPVKGQDFKPLNLHVPTNEDLNKARGNLKMLKEVINGDDDEVEKQLKETIHSSIYGPCGDQENWQLVYNLAKYLMASDQHPKVALYTIDLLIAKGKEISEVKKDQGDGETDEGWNQDMPTPEEDTKVQELMNKEEAAKNKDQQDDEEMPPSPWEEEQQAKAANSKTPKAETEAPVKSGYSKEEADMVINMSPEERWNFFVEHNTGNNQQQGVVNAMKKLAENPYKTYDMSKDKKSKKPSSAAMKAGGYKWNKGSANGQPVHLFGQGVMVDLTGEPHAGPKEKSDSGTSDISNYIDMWKNDIKTEAKPFSIKHFAPHNVDGVEETGGYFTYPHISEWQKTDRVMFDVGNDIPTAVNKTYYDYFKSKYPDATFKNEDNKHPITVYSNGEMVGAMMPLLIDDDDGITVDQIKSGKKIQKKGGR